MASRTTTSLILLIVLLTGMAMPAGACALMCVRHQRAESQRHCGQVSETMPGMVHEHSAMNHPGVEAIHSALSSQSCRTNCVTAERLYVAIKSAPQVRVATSDTVIVDIKAEFLSSDFTAAWSADSGPPAPPPAGAASFTILRI